jgi:hypothetical protein
MGPQRYMEFHRFPAPQVSRHDSTVSVASPNSPAAITRDPTSYLIGMVAQPHVRVGLTRGG